MKSVTKFGAAALAAMMALCMTACGTAPMDTDTENDGPVPYGGSYYANDNGFVQRGDGSYGYGPTTGGGNDPTGGIATDLDRAGRDVGRDMKRAADTITDGVNGTNGTNRTSGTANAARNAAEGAATPRNRAVSGM